MRLPVEAVYADILASNVQSLVVDENRGEHRLLGLQVLRRLAFQDVIGRGDAVRGHQSLVRLRLWAAARLIVRTPATGSVYASSGRLYIQSTLNFGTPI